MKNIYLYETDGVCPVILFLQSLPPKLRIKVNRQLMMILTFPGTFGEPHVKHFQIERYRALYELREKFKGTLIRIIFFFDEEGNIILLESFVKTHSHTTNWALESALLKLERLRARNAAVKQYTPEGIDASETSKF